MSSHPREASAIAAASHRQLMYLRLAGEFESRIMRGVLRVGSRMPSVRSLSRSRGMSVSTVVQAYLWLERAGYIESRPRSGFYVTTPVRGEMSRRKRSDDEETSTDISTLIEQTIAAAYRPDTVNLGLSLVSPSLLPIDRLNRIARQATHIEPLHATRYEHLRGNDELRREIARCSAETGFEVWPDEIIITSGGMEALNLSLRVAAEAGDAVAVESPTYFALLHAIDALHMRPVEIPTDPVRGMDLNALERAVSELGVRAVVTIPTCNNPLGFVASNEWKQALVDLAERHDIAVIEDDVCGDLFFGERRPLPLKAFDRSGRVLMSGSFSKALAPGLRVGWLHAGRHDRDALLKRLSAGVPASLPQVIVAEYLKSGLYPRHLRRLRTKLAAQVEQYIDAVRRHFPKGTRAVRPAGGYLLWIELPEGCDGMRVFDEALHEGICILPGTIFSPTLQYASCIRLNCGYPWNETTDAALKRLGRIVARRRERGTE